MLIRLFRRLVGQPGREDCFYIEFTRSPQGRHLAWLRGLIREGTEKVTSLPNYIGEVIEVGPRLAVETPFSSNAVSICRRMGIPVRRIEMSTRYSTRRFSLADIELDPLTQEIYPKPLTRLGSNATPEPVHIIPFLEEGFVALERANVALGLGMSVASLRYYAGLYTKYGRNPTDVELFQIANMNSEHSRHPFFRNPQVIDGVTMPRTLMEIIKAPLEANPGNSLAAFNDNGGVIAGSRVDYLRPMTPGKDSCFMVEEVLLHITATAETHNHPTMIAPFPGAETGAGGRIRDSRAVGRGAFMHAGVAGYCVGALSLPNYHIPGEYQDGAWSKVGSDFVSVARPLSVLVRGSDGISDYSNKYGEPLLGGFARSFSMMVNGQERAFAKPVLFTAGLGRIDDRNLRKREPEIGMFIVQFGGPAFLIGVGGGVASSVKHGTISSALDLKSVQRGDGQMANRVNRVIQACAEMGDRNPIETIHDQGAGGPSNVLTELIDPMGGTVDIRKITLGDPTMSTLQTWVAEFQERYGILIRPKNLRRFKAICKREGVNCEVLGEITGSGNVVVQDSTLDTTPVDLPLKDVLDGVPPQPFVSERLSLRLESLCLPALTIAQASEMVLRQVAVGSKGNLVRKVDRSVTGLVAMQPCRGPMGVPVADAGVTADSYIGYTGAAIAVGENPNRLLVDVEAGARMSVAEMLTNLMCVRISGIADVACRINWMWPAKLPGEAPHVYDAAVSISDLLQVLRSKADGGKDSLSMATLVGETQVISPGQIVITGYARVPDIRRMATPDLKVLHDQSHIGFIDLGQGKNRLGGSALAQALGQLGNESPDIDDASFFERSLQAIQELHRLGFIRAYHDRSDGGLFTALAEMCIAGNCGAVVDIPDNVDAVAGLFNEEAGMLFEYNAEDARNVRGVLEQFEILESAYSLFALAGSDTLDIRQGGQSLWEPTIVELRQLWEATSTQIELQQANPETVQQEEASFSVRTEPKYWIPFTPRATSASIKPHIRVAILREQGSNGDREMAAVCMAAGLEPQDVNMQDLLSGKVQSLEQFRFAIFPGGFSHADVFGSGKGWAGPLRTNPRLRKMFADFLNRPDTLSLGVCNGFQLGTRLGWLLPEAGISKRSCPRLVHNTSGRFESRWPTVKVLASPAVVFAGMEGMTFGVHVAHGEGRLVFPDSRVADLVREHQLAPLAYVDPEDSPTMAYPYNPNGSTNGWTALCSPDGRHLGMMPHPERCFLIWQCQWMPQSMRSLEVSPWLRMFQNAREWCESH